MKYFSVRNETDYKIIGNTFPQCKGLPSQLGLTYKWFEQPNSMTRLTNDYYPDVHPELVFELDDAANVTDVISPSNISAKGFLVNQKVRDILCNFKLMEHRYYSATVLKRNSTFQYYWLHFIESAEKYLKYVDYRNSSFYLGNLARWREETIEVDSLEEYYNIKKSIGFKTITLEAVHFTEEFRTEQIDLFYIESLHEDLLISDRLTTALYSEKVTGLRVYIPSFLEADA